MEMTAYAFRMTAATIIAPPRVQVSARWAVMEDRIFLDASYGIQIGGVSNKRLAVGGKLAF
jgi:hypothetical protein